MNKNNTLSILLSALLVACSTLNAGGAFSKSKPTEETNVAETEELTPHTCPSILRNCYKAAVRSALFTTGMNPLARLIAYAAVFNNKPQLVKALAQSGINMDVLLLNGKTPLFVAINKGHYETVRTLLDIPVNMNAYDYYGFTPLTLAYARREVRDIVRLLIEAGADINLPRNTLSVIRNKEGTFERKKIATSLLIDAIGRSDLEMIQLLISQNVRLNDGYRENQWTPLMLAVYYNNDTIVDLLLAAHAHINTQNMRKETALTIAVRENHHSLIRTLLHAGAEVNIQNDEGYTILESLIRNALLPSQDVIEVLTMLLESCDTIECTRALAIAKERDFDTIVALLKAYIDKHSQEIMVKPAVG